MKLNLLMAGLVACATLAGGCTKSVDLTIANHSEAARQVQLTTPDGTSAIGAVAADGSMRTKLVVKNSDLPCQCQISAGAGSQQSFSVSDDSPSQWWFHVTKDGKMTGPYGKNDVHAETEKTIDVTSPAGRTTILR